MNIRFWVVAMLMLASAAFPSVGVAATHAEFGRAGDAYLSRAVQRLDAPGAAWAVVRDGRVRHTGAVGAAGDGTSFSAATPVVLGSVSKPLLATTTVELARRGEVDLDQPVAPQLPALAEVDGAETITARMLLGLRGADGLAGEAHRTNRARALPFRPAPT